MGFNVELSGREPGGIGAGLEGSPALSANVFLLSVPGGGGSIVGLALLAEADTSDSFFDGGDRASCGSADLANYICLLASLLIHHANQPSIY